MVIAKTKDDGMGICFARFYEECGALTDTVYGCGTFRCPFYKPSDKRDWIRAERGKTILLISPDEVTYRGAHDAEDQQ